MREKSKLRVVATLVTICATASVLGIAGASSAGAAVITPASVTIKDVTVTEGNAGTSVLAVFTLQVNKRARGPIWEPGSSRSPRPWQVC